MCKNVLEGLYHYAKFGGARISPAAGAAKNVEQTLYFCPVYGRPMQDADNFHMFQLMPMPPHHLLLH